MSTLISARGVSSLTALKKPLKKPRLLQFLQGFFNGHFEETDITILFIYILLIYITYSYFISSMGESLSERRINNLQGNERERTLEAGKNEVTPVFNNLRSEGSWKIPRQWMQLRWSWPR